MATPFYTKLHTNQNAAALCVRQQKMKYWKQTILVSGLIVLGVAIGLFTSHSIARKNCDEFIKDHNIETFYYGSGLSFFINAYAPHHKIHGFRPGWRMSYDDMRGISPLSLYVSFSGKIISSNSGTVGALIESN